MHGTHMSFEYYGAFKALNFLRDTGASKDQAEAVSEAIIRHADLGETGTLSSLGMMIQLSTVFGKFSSFFLIVSIVALPKLRGECTTTSSPLYLGPGSCYCDNNRTFIAILTQGVIGGFQGDLE
jgi:hypothetical protein